MKKELLLSIFVLLSINVFSQNNSINFHFIEGGTFQASDGKDYSVMPCDGESQSDIYNKVLLAVTGLYSSSKDIITKIENEMISVNTLIFDAYSEKSMGIPFRKHVNVVFKFRMKDGNLRIDAPDIQNVYTGDPTSLKGNTEKETFMSQKSFRNETAVYFKKGELNQKRKKTYDEINEAINKPIEDIIAKAFQKDNDW